MSGPQIDNRFVFANRATHPQVNDVMEAAVAILMRGISIVPISQRPSEWQFVAVELADDRLTCKVDYSPFLAQSDALESGPSQMRVAVGGAFDSDTATGMMQDAQRVASVLTSWRS